jgi:hypothetical protein
VLCWGSKKTKKKKTIKLLPTLLNKAKKKGAIFKQIFISEKGKINSTYIYNLLFKILLLLLF